MGQKQPVPLPTGTECIRLPLPILFSAFRQCMPGHGKRNIRWGSAIPRHNQHRGFAFFSGIAQHSPASIPSLAIEEVDSSVFHYSQSAPYYAPFAQRAFALLHIFYACALFSFCVWENVYNHCNSWKTKRRKTGKRLRLCVVCHGEPQAFFINTSFGVSAAASTGASSSSFWMPNSLISGNRSRNHALMVG